MIRRILWSSGQGGFPETREISRGSREIARWSTDTVRTPVPEDHLLCRPGPGPGPQKRERWGQVGHLRWAAMTLWSKHGGSIVLQKNVEETKIYCHSHR